MSDDNETKPEPDFQKEKREIIILVLIFSAVSTFFGLLFDKMEFEQVITLATAIGYGVFILWWCKVDSLERSFELKPGFRLLLVLFGAFALIYYLFRSRGFKEGLNALLYACLIFFAVIITNMFVTGLYSLFFNIEN